MNSRPMVLRFGSGSAGRRRARREKQFLRHPHAPAGCCSGAETDRPRFSAFLEPQQPMIHEHAGELIADRFMDQHRGQRRKSTPPDSPQITLPLPTCARGFSRSPPRGRRAWSRSPVRPATLRTKLRISFGAVRRVHHLGVEHQAVIFALLVLDHGRTAHSARRPATTKPGGILVIRSPWLIQTGWRSPMPQVESNNWLSALTSTSARPNSRW